MISMWTFLKGNTFCCSLVIDKLICQIWFNISTWRSDIYILKLYSIKYCEIIKMYLTLEGMWALEVSGDNLASRETSARTYSSMHCMHKRKVNSIYTCTCTSNEYVYRCSATLGPLDCMRMQLQDLCKRPYLVPILYPPRGRTRRTQRRWDHILWHTSTDHDRSSMLSYVIFDPESSMWQPWHQK